MPGSDIFTPTPDDQIGRMALIEAVRANTDATSRMAQQQNNIGNKLDHISETLGGLNTRLALIENSTLERDLERLRDCTHELEHRIDQLEADKARRQGALGLTEWIGRNWPGIIAFIALIVLMVQQKGIKVP